MRIAAYQAPLLPPGSLEVIELIRARVKWCEAHGIEILCCPEAVLGGLADDMADPLTIAINVGDWLCERLLAPLASEAVTTIVGFTEVADFDHLYNAAAILHRGRVVGVYRKLNPALRRSVYRAGEQTPVFTIGGLTFGIVICNDSNFSGPAKAMAGQGAKVLFIPTNNALPPGQADVVHEARRADIALAQAYRLMVVRADVAGRIDGRVSHGSSSVVAPDGTVLSTARPFAEDLIFADIDLGPQG